MIKRAREAERLRAEREDRARQRQEERAHEIRNAELRNENHERDRKAERVRAEREDRVRLEDYDRAREAEASKQAHEIRLAELSNEKDKRVREAERLRAEREDRIRQEDYERAREAERLRAEREDRIRQEDYERAREADRVKAENKAKQREDVITQLKLRLQADRTEMIYKVVKCLAIAAAAIGGVCVALSLTPAVIKAVATYGPAVAKTMAGAVDRLTLAFTKFHCSYAVTKALTAVPAPGAALAEAARNPGLQPGCIDLLFLSLEKMGLSITAPQ